MNVMLRLQLKDCGPDAYRRLSSATSSGGRSALGDRGGTSPLISVTKDRREGISLDSCRTAPQRSLAKSHGLRVTEVLGANDSETESTSGDDASGNSDGESDSGGGSGSGSVSASEASEAGVSEAG